MDDLPAAMSLELLQRAKRLAHESAPRERPVRPKTPHVVGIDGTLYPCETAQIEMGFPVVILNTAQISNWDFVCAVKSWYPSYLVRVVAQQPIPRTTKAYYAMNPHPDSWFGQRFYGKR